MKQKINSVSDKDNKPKRDDRVYKIYKELLNRFGMQNWWPAQTKYEIVVGVILTQNTAWKNVEKAIENLKRADALSPERIIGMNTNRLKNLIRPAGFYNQKASRLVEVTKAYVKIKEKAREMDVQKLRQYFLNIKGIGKESADSIVLYVFEKPVFVIDAYTKRFCACVLGVSFNEYDEYRDYFETNLPKDVEVYKEYHALIVEWGKQNRGMPKHHKTSIISSE